MPSVESELGRLTVPKLHPDVFAATMVLIVAYALIDPQLRLGARWLLGIVLLTLLIPIVGSRHMGRHDLAHIFGFVSHSVATLAVAGSVGVLGRRALNGDLDARNLLRDAALLWLSNIVVFSLWYWQLDGGGPAERHMRGYVPTDFAFPQTTIAQPFCADWTPRYIDYLFLSFNTSAAFSPTDTLTLSARAKVLMMLQSLISLVSLAVLAARAVNSLR